MYFELNNFFAQYQCDEVLTELLFSFLLKDRFDGSDCQIGLACYIVNLEKKLLRKKKALLLLAPKMKCSENTLFKMSTI